LGQVGDDREELKSSVNLRDSGHCILQLFCVESEGAGLAFVGHVAGGIDQIKSIWPRRVCLLGGVAKFVEHGGNVDSQLAHTGAGDETAFFFTPGAGEDDVVLNIALHLPDVAGMRLGDVDHQERDLLSVLLVELVESGNLPPEGRSSVAAEDEHNRLALRDKR
jgi:hypothetical protein